MTKTRSKVKLCIVALLTVLGLFFTFVSFHVPNTSGTFNGFFQAINFGYDIAGGELSVYKVDGEGFTETEIDERLNEVVMRYNDAFANKGLNITRQDDTIRVEASKYDSDNITKMLVNTGSRFDLFTLIGSEKGIRINTNANEADAEGSITGEYITECKLEASQPMPDGRSYYPVTVKFTEEGQEMLKEMTKKALESAGNQNVDPQNPQAQTPTGKLYIYINGVNYNPNGFDVTASTSELMLTSISKEGAEALRLQVCALARPIGLTRILSGNISSGLNTSTGAFFGNVKIMLIVFLALVFVGTAIFFGVRYRMLGLFGSIAVLIFTVVYSFLLQSIPLVLLDVNGLLGVMLTYGLLITGIVEIFEKIRSEYALGKKIPNSVRSGFKKNVIKILEKYVFLLIFTGIVYLVASPALKALSVSLFVGLFVNYFTLFVALRGMCLSYTVIDGVHNKNYNLKREAVKNEF